jgi:hypothetical protein
MTWKPQRLNMKTGTDAFTLVLDPQEKTYLGELVDSDLRETASDTLRWHES